MTAPLSPVPVFFRNRMRMHVLFHRSRDQMSVASMGSFAIGRRRFCGCGWNPDRCGFKYGVCVLS